MANRLAGILPAVWTPTDSSGNLLVTEIRANLEFLKRHGVHGFMALGSTGEFPLMELNTRRRVVEEIVGAAGRLPVVVNISDIRPKAVIELGKFARKTGSSAVAVLPPFFYHVSQSDLAEFFLRAADAAELPLVLYNFPERTGIRIELETIAAVAERTAVAAVKQSGDDFEYHLPLVSLSRENNFVILTGADTRLSEALDIGVSGSISGMSNAVPQLLVEVFSTHQSGTPAVARLAAERMKALGALMSTMWFPLNISALMAARSLPVGEPKEVIAPMTYQRYGKLVEDFRGLFREWHLM